MSKLIEIGPDLSPPGERQRGVMVPAQHLIKGSFGIGGRTGVPLRIGKSGKGPDIARHPLRRLPVQLRRLGIVALDEIGTEHMLLGLIHEGDGVAAQVLSGLGADLDETREQVIRLLDEHRRKHGHQTG